MSTFTEDLRDDLNAWLDDMSAGLAHTDWHISEVENSIIVINEALPEFIQGWTVAELIAAIKTNQALS